MAYENTVQERGHAHSTSLRCFASSSWVTAWLRDPSALSSRSSSYHTSVGKSGGSHTGRSEIEARAVCEVGAPPCLEERTEIAANLS